MDVELNCAPAANPLGRVAVADLLKMTSGIDWPEPNSIGPLTGGLLFEAYDSAAFAASFPQALPPGQSWNYSTANYNLLQYILRFAAQDKFFVSSVWAG
jgi:CubicO group peptidase (beta-lactamase class C family)